MTRRRVLRGAVGLVLLVAVAAGVRAWMNAPCWQLFGDLVCRVDTDRPVVALTFDDGPTDRGLDAVLPILEAEGVHATFFLIGEQVEARPDLAERLIAAGHQLGNHSWSHRRMVFLGAAGAAEEIGRTDSLLRAAGALGDIPFRPPYGKKLVLLPLHLARTGRLTVTWDIAPEGDAEIAAEAQALVAAVRDAAHPGAIILLHPMYPANQATRDALPGIIRALKADGYGFATVSELLALER